MKKILIILSSLSGFASFVVMLIAMLGGIRKTLLDAVTLTDAEKALIKEVGEPKWTDYFFTILALVALLMAASFITVVIFKDKSNFASASHIVSIIAMLMMALCGYNELTDKTALLYSHPLVIAALVLVGVMYMCLLFYSAVAITKEEFDRYL